MTGSLAWAPVVLFLVVFFWTPPHFWSLAMRYRDDYAAAGVPMLPVVASSYEVGRQIVIYTWVTVVDLAAPLAGRRHRAGSTRWPLPFSARVFLVEAHALWRRARSTEDPVALKAMRLFHWSNAYLALLFLAVAIDPLITR